MTYPPGNPGYPPAQSPGPYGGFNPGFAKSADDTSKLPFYLQVAVVVLGLAAYLASFGPMLLVASSASPSPLGRVNFVVPLTVLAALLAAVGRLPKAKNYTPIVAVLATMAVMLAVGRVLTKSDSLTIGWGLKLVVAFTALQSIAAIVVLLLESGVVTAPAARPKYDPYAQYGLPSGGGYYNQPGQPGPRTGPQSRGYRTGPQQPGYPAYGSYPPGPAAGGFGTPPGPSTGGFGVGTQRIDQQGPPTPPTGFPSFSSPPSGGAGIAGGQGHDSADSGQSGQGQPPLGDQGSQPPCAAGSSAGSAGFAAGPSTGASTGASTAPEPTQP